MLIIKTKLKEFNGKGIGLIADEFVKKGRKVWIYNSVVDILIDKKSIPKEAKKFYEKYSITYSKNKVILNTDNARFINHSENPNIKNPGYKQNMPLKDIPPNVAIRNIKKGEEITIDYRTIDMGPLDFKIIEK